MNTTKLTERDFSLLKKYCGNGIETRWRGILKRLNGGERIRVVNTGVVSSGKSSILNALTDHIDEERFPTGAARTTTIADEYEYGDNILFVDTPGIDVTAADDATAFDTVVTADVIMMVHNIRTGVLTRNELEWLERISAHMEPGAIRSRFIFVCSWMDTRDREENCADLVQDLKESVQRSLGVEIPFFEVSAKRYLSRKPALMKKSNIPELREMLSKRAEHFTPQTRQDLKDLYEQTQLLLSQSRYQRHSKIEMIEEEVSREVAQMRMTGQTKLNVFRRLCSTYQDLCAELRQL